MARRRKGGKRGRPYNPNAKRHQTTRAGRRGDVDEGSPLLLAKKLRFTGRGDVEMNGSGVLFGHGLIDRQQYDMLGVVTLLLRRVAAACGRGYTVHGLWLAILSAATRTGYTVPLLGDQNARRSLERMCGCLNGSRALVIELAEGRLPAIVLRAASQRLTPFDRVEIDELRAGLDDLAAPRRAPRLLAQPHRPAAAP
jgi:hypothetical protein